MKFLKLFFLVNVVAMLIVPAAIASHYWYNKEIYSKYDARYSSNEIVKDFYKSKGMTSKDRFNKMYQNYKSYPERCTCGKIKRYYQK
jgi:hypothetical protein